MSETKLVRDIQMLSRGDVRLFRNNVGNGFLGTDITTAAESARGVTVLIHARRVQFGLCPGSSDLIGWQTTKITQDMVGTYFAKFVALEVKKPKAKPTEEQVSFLCAVGAAGGTPGIVRSLQEACQVLNIDENGNTLKP